MTLSAARDFGIQSVSFRHYKQNAAVAQAIRKLGLNKVELFSGHADFTNIDTFKEIATIYSDAGVKIESIGVQTFAGDKENERKWFECATLAGAKLITAHFRVETFHEAVPVAVELCEEFDLRVGIHCNGGHSFCGSLAVVSYLAEFGSPDIGVCLDTAWCMQVGPLRGNPIKWVDHLKHCIYGVHYKDFVFERNGQWRDVVVGTGNLDLPAFVKSLEAVGFSGVAMLEYEGDIQDPVPALTKCIKQLRSVPV